MYKYENIADKTKQGILNELETGLAKMAIYFYTSYGIPPDIFNDKLKNMHIIEQLNAYMSFRNENPLLFRTNE